MEKVQRILIVDDDHDACTNLADILRDQGLHVDVAFNGRSALELVERQHYALALLDYKMPDMDGVTLYQRIQARRPAMAAVLITAFAAEEARRRAEDSGAWRILAKPVEMGQLLPLVYYILRRLSILVVDDDCDFSESLWQVLRQERYHVDLAHNGQQARARMRDHRSRVVVADLRLDDEPGLDLLSRIRREHPDVNVIVITGYPLDAEEARRRLAELGVSDICLKPLDLPDFLQRIARFEREQPAEA